jgi:uncharacterized lipoprotein YddW (UPF0748 family)
MMEIRGVWMPTTDSNLWRSRDRIAEAIAFLAETGFNVLCPVVWTRGLTLYPSAVMHRTFGVEIDPRFAGRDPLAEAIAEAKKCGMAVIPWFEYGFASSYNCNGGMLLEKKPDWAARDRAGNLLCKNGFEWMNAFYPPVQHFLRDLILEVATRYDIAGIQGDDRLPALPSEGGYDAFTVQRYRDTFDRDPPDNPQQRQWLQWRADILTEFLAQLYRDVKGIDENLLVSLSPNIYRWCLSEYLQDSRTWIEREIVDLMHPQIYRRDAKRYQQIVREMVYKQYEAQHLPRIAPGILIKLGKYRIGAEDLLQAIACNRACHLPGEVLFFYEGLRQDNDELAKVLRSHAYAKPAAFPTAAELEQRAIAQQKSRFYPRGLSAIGDWLKRLF